MQLCHRLVSTTKSIGLDSYCHKWYTQWFPLLTEWLVNRAQFNRDFHFLFKKIFFSQTSSNRIYLQCEPIMDFWLCQQTVIEEQWKKRWWYCLWDSCWNDLIMMTRIVFVSTNSEDLLLLEHVVLSFSLLSLFDEIEKEKIYQIFLIFIVRRRMPTKIFRKQSRIFFSFSPLSLFLVYFWLSFVRFDLYFLIYHRFSITNKTSVDHRN